MTDPTPAPEPVELGELVSRGRHGLRVDRTTEAEAYWAETELSAVLDYAVTIRDAEIRRIRPLAVELVVVNRGEETTQRITLDPADLVDLSRLLVTVLGIAADFDQQSCTWAAGREIPVKGTP